jgi:Holliday junction resolvase RusA-like endonuclease
MTLTITAEQYRKGAHRMIATPFDGGAVRYGCLALALPPLSVNNLFANGAGGGKGRFATKLYKEWQARALLQLRQQTSWHVPGPCRIKLRFSRQQTRADLDNLAKPVLDILVKAGRISDDRNVRELLLKFSDKANGCLIDIWEAACPIDSAPKEKCAASLAENVQAPDPRSKGTNNPSPP